MLSVKDEHLLKKQTISGNAEWFNEEMGDGVCVCGGGCCTGLCCSTWYGASIWLAVILLLFSLCEFSSEKVHQKNRVGVDVKSSAANYSLWDFVHNVVPFFRVWLSVFSFTQEIEHQKWFSLSLSTQQQITDWAWLFTHRMNQRSIQWVRKVFQTPSIFTHFLVS